MKVLYCGETFPEARRRLAARLTESGHEFLSCAEKDIVDYLDGLDVFGEDPVDPNHPLLKQNVVATPHIAGVTDVSYDGTAKGCAENINRYARGEAPLYAANAPLTRAGRFRPRNRGVFADPCVIPLSVGHIPSVAC